MKGNLKEAKDTFHRVQAQPQRAEVWVNLAHAFRGMDQDKKAIESYMQALQQIQNSRVFTPNYSNYTFNETKLSKPRKFNLALKTTP